MPQSTVNRSTQTTPLNELIVAIGAGVAQAQRALDQAALETAQEISTSADLANLRAIGYQPTWYHIPEAEAEITVALSLSSSGEESGTKTSSAASRVVGTPVDASYSGRYSFSVQAASRLRFKIVPIPAPPAANETRYVPDVVGLSVEAASATLQANGLGLNVGSGLNSSSVVKTQSPTAGASAAPGATVELR